MVLWRIMTYTGQIRLATTWIIASRALRRNGSLSAGHSFAEREKTEEERRVFFASIGQEASKPPSQMGVLEHPGAFGDGDWLGTRDVAFSINCLSIGLGRKFSKSPRAVQ